MSTEELLIGAAVIYFATRPPPTRPAAARTQTYATQATQQGSAAGYLSRCASAASVGATVGGGVGTAFAVVGAPIGAAVGAGVGCVGSAVVGWIEDW